MDFDAPNTRVGVQEIDQAIALLLTVADAAERVADKRLLEIEKGDSRGCRDKRR